MWKFAPTRKRAIVIALGLAVIIVSLFLFVTRLQPIRVALSWLHQAQFAGMYVAEAKDFYKNEGISPHFIERDFQVPLLVDLLAKKQADIAIMSPSDFLHAADQGEDVVALAAVFQISPIVLASLEKANIRSPKDLVGKKVGLAVLREESKLPIYALLEEAGTSKDAVTFLEVGSNQVDALRRGDVDVISVYRTNELYELEKEHVPYSLLLPERFGVDLYGDIIVVSREYLQRHEEEIGAFLRATFKGWRFAERNQEEAVQITLAVDNPKYHDSQRETYILKNAVKLVRLYPKQAMGQMIPLHWAYMHALLQEHGLINEIDLDRFFPTVEMYQKLDFPKY